MLFLGAWCAIALLTKTTPYSAHEYSRLGTIESLVERGTYQLDESIFITTIDKIYRDGHYYSHQTPLLPTLEAPVYWVLRLPGMRFNNSGRLVMTYLMAWLTNGLALALTVVVFSRLLSLAGIPPPWRDLHAVLWAFGTWLLPYGLVTNGHGISGLLLAVVVYLLLRIEWHGVTGQRLLTLGGALGAVAAIELLPLVSFVPLTLTYLATRGDMTMTQWRTFAACLVAPLVIQALINLQITGDVIPAGFHHELFLYPGSAFDASSLTGTLKFDSASAFFTYAWTALVAGRGYFTFAPLLLLAMIAGVVEWRWWWARARGVYVVLFVGTFLSLGAALVTSNQYGGESVGFRFATYLAPAMLTLLLPWMSQSATRRLAPRAVLVAGLASVIAMLLFAAPKPWSVLEVEHPRLYGMEDHAPVVIKMMRGELLSP